MQGKNKLLSRVSFLLTMAGVSFSHPLLAEPLPSKPLLSKQSTAQPPRDQTPAEIYTIYIYRMDDFINRALNPSIFLNGKRIAKLLSESCIRIDVTAGQNIVSLGGEFPDWVEKYNKSLSISVTSLPIYLKLEPVYTGVVTPQELESDYEFYPVTKLTAKQDGADCEN